MSLNSLKIASDGYLKGGAKAVLIIAVSGYLSFASTTPPVIPQGSRTVYYESEKHKDSREELYREDEEILIILKVYMKCV